MLHRMVKRCAFTQFQMPISLGALQCLRRTLRKNNTRYKGICSVSYKLLKALENSMMLQKSKSCEVLHMWLCICLLFQNWAIWLCARVASAVTIFEKVHFSDSTIIMSFIHTRTSSPESLGSQSLPKCRLLTRSEKTCLLANSLPPKR